MNKVSPFCIAALSKHPIFGQFSKLSLSQHTEQRKPCIYFIVPPGRTVEECLTLNLGEMYKTAEAHALNVMWLEDGECKGKEFHAEENMFVFDPFGSLGYQYLMKRLFPGGPRVKVLGPMVFRNVFKSLEDLCIQTGESPLCTLAMKDMLICLSGIKDKATKDELENLIRCMNGTLSSNLTLAVSYVVTANALTPKCIEAHKGGIPVMTCDWLRQLWKDNQSNNVAPSDIRYASFKCPVFHNVNICMSQILTIKKEILTKAVKDHGKQLFLGTFNGGNVRSQFVKKEADVLVVQNPTGDKFNFAQRWNVPCVTPDWIEQSLKKGHILPTDDFKVTPPEVRAPVSPIMNRYIPTMMVSTPIHSVMMPAEWNMSAIPEVNDTIRDAVEKPKLKVDALLVDAMSKLKTSAENLHLDGCKIYVVEYPRCDELKRALNKSGAVSMDILCEGVTHIIVNPDGQNLPKSVQEKILALGITPHVVTNDWVLQSAKDGSRANEELYKYQQQPEGLLVGLTFKVVNSDEAERKGLEETVIKNGGTLVQDNPTVVILETIIDSIEKDGAENAYTKHWLFDCIELDTLDLNHLFHYTPLCSFREMDGIFTGVVVAISQHGTVERQYIAEVVNALGGIYQDVLARKDTYGGNKRSTHLICKTMDTDKAKAARQWNVSIVLAEWVTMSYNSRKRLDEDRFDPAKVVSDQDQTTTLV